MGPWPAGTSNLLEKGPGSAGELREPLNIAAKLFRTLARHRRPVFGSWRFVGGASRARILAGSWLVLGQFAAGDRRRGLILMFLAPGGPTRNHFGIILAHLGPLRPALGHLGGPVGALGALGDPWGGPWRPWGSLGGPGGARGAQGGPRGLQGGLLGAPGVP